MEQKDATLNILVTAATWYIGSQTISAIKKENVDATVVAGVYSGSKKVDERELWQDADETYHMDANDRNSLDFSRFEVVCIIPSTNPRRLTQFANMIDECKHCVSHPFVVFCSIADTFGYEGDFAKSTRHMEAMLQSSGLKYVIINCGFFHENFEWNAHQMRTERSIRLPIGKGEFAPIDARDVARFIAIIMKDIERHESNCYTMTGQQLISGYGAARIASQALGYEINFKDIPASQYFQELIDQDCSDGMANALCELCLAIKKNNLQQTISRPLYYLSSRMVKLKDYFADFPNIYGSANVSMEEPEKYERTQISDTQTGYWGNEREIDQGTQPGYWGNLNQADEGFAERKEEETEEARKVGEGWEQPTQRGVEKENVWTAPPQREYAYRDMEEEPAEEVKADRDRGWSVRNSTWGRGEDLQTAKEPPPVEEERVVAIERDVYYLKPKNEKRIDVLRKIRQDYEEYLKLLTDAIADLTESIKERGDLLQADERLVVKLQSKKDEIRQALRQLDQEIQDLERREEERPRVAYPTSIPPITKGLKLVSRHDEKLEGGRRFVERYESSGREPEYESYDDRERMKRYPEERRYPEQRRETRTSSATHIGRELERGRTSTKLGREMNNYKGENFIARISHLLYGWKDKGEQEHGGREFEGGDRRSYRREGDVDRRDYERQDREREDHRRREFLDRQEQERRTFDLEEQDREREERRRRDLEEQDREREERRRRDLEWQDNERRNRELERQDDERRRRDILDRQDREHDRLRAEHRTQPVRPLREKTDRELGPDDRDEELRREYELKKRELQTEPYKSETREKRVSFGGKRDEEERYDQKYRSRRRDSGLGRDSEEFVLIPKHVLQEAVVSVY